MPLVPLAPGTGTPLLSLHNVSVSRGGKTIIRHIDLAIRPGEILTVIGPNGAGKSTLIKTALGLIRPDAGTVHRNSDAVVGYVPQSVSLDPALPLTVGRFLALTRSAGESRWRACLEQVGIPGLLDASMHDISGGEMRRVLMARALLRGPQLLILDEPTAGVDVSGQGALYRLIQKIRDEYRCAVLLVSHDLHVVMAATNRVLCLNQHICCSGAPDQIREHPEYLAIFGRQDSAEIGIYRHHHDHHHDLHGEVCEHHDPPADRSGHG